MKDSYILTLTKYRITSSGVQKNMSRVMRKPTFWFPTWSNTNQAVQLQKMARGLKFRILVVEGLYYPCSENKGADQLRGLCNCLCKKPVFSRRGSYKSSILSIWKQQRCRPTCTSMQPDQHHFCSLPSTFKSLVSEYTETEITVFAKSSDVFPNSCPTD